VEEMIQTVVVRWLQLGQSFLTCFLGVYLVSISKGQQADFGGRWRRYRTGSRGSIHALPKALSWIVLTLWKNERSSPLFGTKFIWVMFRQHQQGCTGIRWLNTCGTRQSI